MSKQLIVFTSPNWPEFNRHWRWLNEDQKVFCEGEGIVSPYNGGDYYCQGGSGWDFYKIGEILRNSQAEELAVLIHDTYEATKRSIKQILNEISQVRYLVFGYGGAGEPEPFKSFIKTLCEGTQLRSNHFDNLWNFIWTDESYRKAIECRSRTVLPFLALHLLRTAKSDFLPSELLGTIKEEINCAGEWFEDYFDRLGLPAGDCQQWLDELKEATICSDELRNNLDPGELSKRIESLLNCLNTALAKYMTKNDVACQ